MRNPKGNEYGLRPIYDVGDTVRIWPIYKNPIGTVEAIVDVDSFPIKYRVSYRYFEGGSYSEIFEECDLTLMERRWSYGCNCKTHSEMHAMWCTLTAEFKKK